LSDIASDPSNAGASDIQQSVDGLLAHLSALCGRNFGQHVEQRRKDGQLRPLKKDWLA
jgi:hypothetical protein